MNVVIIASEAVPFSKSGGLADIAGSLPGALEKLGAEVMVISPLYRSVRKHALESCPELITVPMGSGTAWGAVRRSGKFHFLEHDQFFDRPGLYGNGHGDYPDNVARFVFLCRGALELLSIRKIVPDIIHVHDWQSGLVPLYVRTLYAGAFPGTRTVLTLHNLAYQGRFWKVDLPVTGFGWDRFTWRELEYFDDLNFLKAGIVHADGLTTVSPTYSREIQTAEYGWGLDGVLRDRAGSLRGILNGVDYEEWSPERDLALAAPYSADSLDGKAQCKEALQRRCGLPLRPDVPLLGMVGRLVEQKGVDLLIDAADQLGAREVQLVVLGTGDRGYEDGVQWLASRLRGRASIQVAFDNEFAHQIIAGSDVLLVPSRYEPCGLTQIYALRYGTLPVVRTTGGLADTVEHGVTGFRFDHATPEGLVWAVDRALEAWRDRDRWRRLMRAAMSKDFSWDTSAREYLRLFESLTRR